MLPEYIWSPIDREHLATCLRLRQRQQVGGENHQEVVVGVEGEAEEEEEGEEDRIRIRIDDHPITVLVTTVGRVRHILPM